MGFDGFGGFGGGRVCWRCFVMEKERIPLLLVYRHDGCFCADFGQDIENDYALYGFLKCLVKDMEGTLLDNFS